MVGDLLVEVKDLSKNFGQTKALKKVNLKFFAGEIRGLIGENGSGKSTVTSIISGMQTATSGEVYFKGKKWKPESMSEAQKHGIAMVLQEANTACGCSVAENIFAGRFEEFTKFGIVNMKKINDEAAKMLKNLGITNIKATDSLDKLTFEDRKLIEIVRCMTKDVEVCIFDETTTALSHEGRTILYKLIRQMKDEGKCVIFISHDMDEIMEQCSYLTVLRDGEIIGHLNREEMDENNAEKKIRYMMVGREIGDAYYRADFKADHLDETALEFINASFGNVKDLTFKLHKGEIIGLGGLSSCGMHEVGRAAFGIEKISKGKVLLFGKDVLNPLNAIRLGAGYISKNRDTEALIMDGTIGENIALPSLSDISKFSYISPKKERDLALAQIEPFRIKCESEKKLVSSLSGGNKQKVSFAKWTARNSDILIMDCPTRGVDIGVKQFMYSLIEKMKKEGKAILLISEEMSELIGMCDKIIIMKDFKISGELERSANLKETDIIEYMI